MERERKKVLSLEISTGKYQEFVDDIIDLAQSGESHYVSVVAVHVTIEAYDDPALAKAVNESKLIVADGMPIVKAMKLLHGYKQERVAGMDLLPSLLKEAEKKGISIYFYGGTQSMLDKTDVYLKEHYPGLKPVSYFSPPFRPLNEKENDEIIEEIRKSGAQLIFVILGCPKQERWMAINKGRLNACMIGVGGALPVMIGEQKRAPLWMQKSSLEWLYRLSQEPKRLFKRYFYTNSKFLLLLAGAYIKKLFGKA